LIGLAPDQNLVRPKLMSDENRSPCADAAAQIVRVANEASKQVDGANLRARYGDLVKIRDRLRSMIVTRGDTVYTTLSPELIAEGEKYGLFDYIEYEHAPINCRSSPDMLAGNSEDRLAKKNKATAQRKGPYATLPAIANQQYWLFNDYLTKPIPLPYHDEEIAAIGKKLDLFTRLVVNAIENSGIVVNCADCRNVLDIEHMSGASTAQVTQYINCLGTAGAVPEDATAPGLPPKAASSGAVLFFIIFVLVIALGAAIVFELKKKTGNRLTTGATPPGTGTGQAA
jgi:hypothetical protein